MRADCKTLVITVGPWHAEPWWWEQIAATGLQAHVRYERLSIAGLQQKQMGLAHLPRLLRRLWQVLKRARRERIDYIVTFESDLSCYMLGALQTMPWLRGPRHVIVQFITQERVPSLSSKLRHAFARLCLSSVHRFICSSRAEANYYASMFAWPDRFLYVPFHTDAKLLALSSVEREDFIISAGRAHRDFETLAQAVAGTGIRTYIVCGRNAPDFSTLAPEVTVIREMPFADLMQKMARARLVVVPLHYRRISTGQSFFLQAMALGVPVIATRTVGTEDYISHGKTGMLVPPSDPAAMREAIVSLWGDAARCERIGAAGRKQIMAAHLPEHYATQVKKVLANEAVLARHQSG